MIRIIGYFGVGRFVYAVLAYMTVSLLIKFIGVHSKEDVTLVAI